MVPFDHRYPVSAENIYGSTPRRCRQVDVLVLGAAIGLASVRHLLEEARQALARPVRVAVADAGPLDLLSHLAHAPGFDRRPFLQAGTERFGGRLALWGVSAPRPPDALLRRWPYPLDDLQRRFARVEAELGVPDRIPKSGGFLEAHLLERLGCLFPDSLVRVAPLAINQQGQRWCPLAQVPELARQGVQLLPHFRCTELVTLGSQVTTVRGQWLDGRFYKLYPRVVVLGVGLEPSLPLLRPLCRRPLRLEASDHLRIDLHGELPAAAFGGRDVEQLGVAVLLMECAGLSHRTSYHLEIKIAPKALWSRGYMPSGDNLRGDDGDHTVWVQIQAVATMHDRFPPVDLLNVDGALPPVMSARDASFHGEIVARMQRVAAALGVQEPVFNLRPLLSNHHAYGAYRVGRAVDRAFRWAGLDNLYVLPPAAFVDVDDDANPTLKSLVLAQYAVESVVRDLAAAPAETKGNPDVVEFSI